MISNDYRRQHIQKLIRKANKDAAKRGKQIETIDPIMFWANKLYPYLPDNVKTQYSRTALRIIKENYSLKDASLNVRAQTSLLTFTSN
jgi:hypothetical protein